MKYLLTFVICLIVVFNPVKVNGQECGQLASGKNLKINRTKICVVDNSARECFVIVDPCPIQ